MNRLDLERLATFSDSVRDSTLKRLRRVPVGRENDTVLDGMMSAADIAAHLIDSDQSKLALSATKFRGKSLGATGRLRCWWVSQATGVTASRAVA